jgi:hypothetical protein
MNADSFRGNDSCTTDAMENSLFRGISDLLAMAVDVRSTTSR